MRRGFKSECNSYSREFREELGLSPEDPLSPWDLAKILDIQVFGISYFKNECLDSVKYLYSSFGSREFSGLVVKVHGVKVIFHNDSHSMKRQASNIMHEISHCVLMHEMFCITDEKGRRELSQNDEQEAQWMGPALLISEEAALRIASEKMPIAVASDLYGASEEVVRMRLNTTGALKRVARRAA